MTTKIIMGEKSIPPTERGKARRTFASFKACVAQGIGAGKREFVEFVRPEMATNEQRTGQSE